MWSLSEHSASRSVAAADDRPARASPEVSGVLLRVLADVALQYGIKPAALFHGEAARFIAGEPMAVRVPLAEYRALLRRALELTGDPALGLRCGIGSSEAAFDLIAPLVAHVPSLRAAIREASQFLALVFDGAYLHLNDCSTGAGVARLCWEFPREGDLTDRFIAELLMAGALRMVRGFGGARGDLYAARFEHRTPSYARAYGELFQGAERFSDALTGLEFAAELLDRPHLHANPALHRLVHAQAEQRLAQLARPASVVRRLEALLLNQPAAHVPEMSAAARQLGVSVRSLRRKLADEGQSYRALTQQLQRERACAMLRNPDLGLQAIADALGFADLVSFHHAFKRWTGQTASEYRAARRAPTPRP